MRCAAQQRPGEPRHRIDDLLAVVQDEQRPAVPQGRGEPLLGPGRRALSGRTRKRVVAQAQRSGDDLREIGHAPALTGEFDQPHPVGGVLDPPGRLDRESRLAHPAGAGERDQAFRGEELTDLGQGALTAQKCRERGGKVRPRAFGRRWRGARRSGRGGASAGS